MPPAQSVPRIRGLGRSKISTRLLAARPHLTTTGALGDLMADVPLVALGVKPNDYGLADSFEQGRTAAINQTTAQMQQQAHTIEMLGNGAAYALDQGLDGPVNPAKWNEVLDSYAAA